MPGVRRRSLYALRTSNQRELLLQRARGLKIETHVQYLIRASVRASASFLPIRRRIKKNRAVHKGVELVRTSININVSSTCTCKQPRPEKLFLHAALWTACEILIDSFVSVSWLTQKIRVISTRDLFFLAWHLICWAYMTSGGLICKVVKSVQQPLSNDECVWVYSALTWVDYMYMYWVPRLPEYVDLFCDYCCLVLGSTSFLIFCDQKKHVWH